MNDYGKYLGSLPDPPVGYAWNNHLSNGGFAYLNHIDRDESCVGQVAYIGGKWLAARFDYEVDRDGTYGNELSPEKFAERHTIHDTIEEALYLLWVREKLTT